MNRWLASRWMVIGSVLCALSFTLDWFKGAASFVVIVPAFFGLAGVKQWRDVRRREMGWTPDWEDK